MQIKLKVKPVYNKNNKQINISLPKKQLPKDFFKIPINKRKLLEIVLEGL